MLLALSCDCPWQLFESMDCQFKTSNTAFANCSDLCPELGKNLKNRSTVLPFPYTYLITNDNWSVWLISGVESTIKEKHFASFNSSIMIRLTSKASYSITPSQIPEDKYDVLPEPAFPYLRICMARNGSIHTIHQLLYRLCPTPLGHRKETS